MKYFFGDKIRAVREKKGLTMKDVAGKAGVTESLISQIERNKVSPALDTLLSISDVLDIDLEYLFRDLRKTKAVEIVRHGERHKYLAGGVVFEQLSRAVGTDREHAIEAYYLEIEPGSSKGSTEYGHTGKEMGIIIEGMGLFTFGTESYALEPGDSVSFSSDIPHVLKNTGKKKLKAYWVVTPPKMFFNEI